MLDSKAIQQARNNIQNERDSAALYLALADAETQEPLKQVYRRLAETETRHAEWWESKLRAGGQEPGRYVPSWRTRVLGWLARRFGASAILSAITAAEDRDSHAYDSHPEAREAGLAADERSHSRLFRQLAGSSSGGFEGGMLAQLEGRHRSMGGNALRAAVLGANDGLVSNFSLVMGVAGAALAPTSILITGLAGLLAGSISMALGEWLSVQSSRELYHRQISIEKGEVEAIPEEEQHELALIYQAKGVPAEQAQALAAHIMADQTTALDTLSREELGIDPQELGGSAWVAAGTSFLLFSLGAIIPVLPFFFGGGAAAIAVSAALSAVGLFAIGTAITLMTGLNPILSGLRQVVFGLLAAAVTFGIGHLFGVGLGG